MIKDPMMDELIEPAVPADGDAVAAKRVVCHNCDYHDALTSEGRCARCNYLMSSGPLRPSVTDEDEDKAPAPGPVTETPIAAEVASALPAVVATVPVASADAAFAPPTPAV